MLAREDPAILGIVLTGSAARGMATEHSDVDVFVVLTDDAAEGRETSRARRSTRSRRPWPTSRTCRCGGVTSTATAGATATRRSSATTPAGGSPRPYGGGDAHRGRGAADAARRRPARRLRQHGLPRAQVRPRRAPSRAPPRRRRVGALVARRRLHPRGPGPSVQQVPPLGAARAPAQRPGVVGRPPAAAGRGGPGRRRGRRTGGVRRRRARVPRLGRAARRPRPPRPHRELG